MTMEFMTITFLLFLAGIVMVPLASRWGLGSVLGYLIAGILIGPMLQYIGADVVSLQHFAEFGVVMMLFLIGLEMSPRTLWQMRSRIFVLGSLQVGLTIAAVMLLAINFGLSWNVGLVIGMILALSSTAIVTQTLAEKSLMQSDGGRSSFAVLLFQDIAVIPILILVPLLAIPGLEDAVHAAEATSHEAESFHLSLVEGLNGWQTAAVTLAAIGVVIVLGRFLSDRIFRFVARARLRELFVTTALMLVLAIALLMNMVGLSAALGTFLAGVVMASSEFRHEVESDIEPFKGMFLGVFFITVGASIDFALLMDNLELIIGLTLGLMALKAGVLLLLSRIFNIAGANQWLFSLGLAQAGEFAFVLISFSVASAALPKEIADIMLLVVALSMLLTPALFILYDRLIAPRFANQSSDDAEPIDAHQNIIIAGHGRYGGIVNRVLRAAGYQTTVLDYSAEHLKMLCQFNFKVFYGDATRPDLLNAAGINQAKIFVIAIDNKQAITNLAAYMAKNHPQVHVIARAIDRMHVYDLWSVGCRDIIRETYDSSLRTARSALEALQIDRDMAERMIGTFDHLDREAMVEMADLYDINIPVTENKPYMEKARKMVEDREKLLQGKMAEILRNS